MLCKYTSYVHETSTNRSNMFCWRAQAHTAWSGQKWMMELLENNAREMSEWMNERIDGRVGEWMECEWMDGKCLISWWTIGQPTTDCRLLDWLTGWMHPTTTTTTTHARKAAHRRCCCCCNSSLTSFRCRYTTRIHRTRVFGIDVGEWIGNLELYEKNPEQLYSIVNSLKLFSICFLIVSSTLWLLVQSASQTWISGCFCAMIAAHSWQHCRRLPHFCCCWSQLQIPVLCCPIISLKKISRMQCSWRSIAHCGRCSMINDSIR